MPFSLHVSNDLHELAKQLQDDLKTAGISSGPFSPQFILTQTDGMKTWLQHTLAEGLGIAADIEFLQPKDLMSRLQYHVLGHRGGRESLSKDELCWGIYALLAEPSFAARFPEKASYYADDDIRRIAFAWKLADLFDQYQVYRWKTVAEWNAMTPEQVSSTADWQAVLWCGVRERFRGAGFDRVEIAESIIRGLISEEHAARVVSRMPQLHLFGVAVITPFFLRLFEALARHIDIRMYLINPAPLQYWLDDKSEARLAYLRSKHRQDAVLRSRSAEGNDLLLNWGQIIRESFQLLFLNDHFVNIYDDSRVVEPPSPTTLLERIQSAVFANRSLPQLAADPVLRIGESQTGDGSIVLNGCYTPAREVETLYNYLVDLVADSPEPIAARDILVLVSDIDRYAPYIRSVFGHGSGTDQDGRPGASFPYSIADDALTSGANLFSALLRILEFPGDRFKAEDVLGLLELPLVRKRFRLGELDDLRAAVREADIHFGYAGDSQYSWQVGLQRMMLGLCMLVDENHEFEADGKVILPLTSEEGSGGQDRIRLGYFVRVLADKVMRRQQDRTISEWMAYLKEVVDDMVFDPDEEDTESYPEFIRMVEEMSVWEDPFQQKIPFDVFLHQFRSRLVSERRSNRFVSRGITFCSLVPMRSIPFRVVAMLGMNFDEFPRHQDPLAFSLLAGDRQLGDRNVRQNDNHLFLETLLSAREKLYISYLARSDKDGSDLPPSALVDELIDFVARAAGSDTDELRKKWVRIHPLHPFSSAYDGRTLRNYLSPNRYLTGVELETSDRTAETGAIRQIRLDRLKSFLQSPPMHYLTSRFGIRYEWDESELIADHELFELDNIQSSNLRSRLLRVPEGEKDRFIRSESLHGRLPSGNFALATVWQASEELAELSEAFRREVGESAAQTTPIALTLDGLELEGHVTDLYAVGEKLLQVVTCVNKSEDKYFLRGFVDLLALTAAGHRPEFIFINRDGEVTRLPSGSLTGPVAMEILRDWLRLYVEGSGAMVPYALELASLADAHANDAQGLKEALDKVMKPDAFYPVNDQYLRRAWEDGFMDSPDQIGRFVDIATRISQPIRDLGLIDLFIKLK